MKTTLALILLLPILCTAQHRVSSPNGAIKVTVTAGEAVTISAEFNGTTIMPLQNVS